jgi:hypothetical protein
VFEIAFRGNCLDSTVEKLSFTALGRRNPGDLESRNRIAEAVVVQVRLLQ